MSRDDDYERFARNATLGTMLSLHDMAGHAFTEHDREAMKDGLDIIRVALVQPVGATSAAKNRPGCVTDMEYDRAQMQVVVTAMELYLSGKLDEVEVDDE